MPRTLLTQRQDTDDVTGPCSGSDQVSQDPAVEPQARPSLVNVSNRSLERFPVWMSTREAQDFLRCKTLKATYEWLRRHGIVRRSNGSVLRRDLERELNRKRTRRVMSPASLLNLRKRSA